ncbi:MAG: IclR family transcriptional regulator [Advenella sp.]|uniref:IclR family transcriptional regulator n=1 Tax=Advenella kashmirensis TaxID=310575 RepID=A0A356LBR2_9BURK|nr:IclR family transcriptional regulator [Advenella sp. FME57]HBP27965.1 IclR family transcriptional regulator [Advenella kashmirensis]
MTSHKDEAMDEIAGAQVVKRISALLKAIASRNAQGSRLVDLYRALNLGQSTVHRLLKALVVEGLVQQNIDSKRYFLGPSIFEFSLAVKPTLDIRALAHDAMERIATFSEDTVYLLIRSRYESVCIERMEGSYPVKVLSLDIGGRRPLGANASGLTILGSLAQDEIDRIIEHNKDIYPRYGMFTVERVRQKLAEFKEHGYVCTQLAPGTLTVGLPILSSDGTPVAAISVAAIEGRMQESRQEEIVDFVRNEIAKLQRILAKAN